MNRFRVRSIDTHCLKLKVLNGEIRYGNTLRIFGKSYLLPCLSLSSLSNHCHPATNPLKYYWTVLRLDRPRFDTVRFVECYGYSKPQAKHQAPGQFFSNSVASTRSCRTLRVPIIAISVTPLPAAISEDGKI